MGPTEAEANSNLTGTVEGALTKTAGKGGTQSHKGRTQSMSTATDQLSSQSTMVTIEEGVVHPEIGGGAECVGRAQSADKRGLWGVEV